ncbi:MAG: CHAT domain-containing protein, partial [Actinomycetota bacterium]|nr:CHAT domain-containing protein [Actinomycetota bacterium]
DVADAADAPAALPRADYIRVQTYFANGEFDAALRMVESAREGYVALRMTPQALRTDAGKMALLLEIGRYQEALDVGWAVLEDLAGVGGLDSEPTREESDLLAAIVHQNLGGCYEHMGDYEEALAAWALAKELYQGLGLSERVGEMNDSQGVVLRYLGRGNEALRAHEAAAAVFERADLKLSHATALGNIGEAHLQLGNYTKGLRAFERARRLLDSLDARVDKHILLLDTANTYLALNLYPEALSAYREADQLLQDAGMTYERARCLWGMGSALIAVSEFESAGRVLAEAADLFSAVDNAPLLSGVLLEQASLLAACGDRKAALATARRALALVSEGDWPVQQFYAYLRLADLLPDEAEPHLLAAQRLAGRLTLPQLQYRLNERLGHLRRLQGRGEEARALLEQAVDDLERLRGAVAQDAIRASFLRDKTAAYEDLLRLRLDREGQENLKDALAVAEQAKSRALVDLIAGVADGGPVELADPALKGSIETLQSELNAIYGKLLGGRQGSDDGRTTTLPKLHERAAELEQEISRLRLQAAAGSSSSPFVSPVQSVDALDLLPPDTALIAYHVIGDEIMAFVGVRGRVRVVRNLCTVKDVQRLLRKLATQWARFRAGQDFARRHMRLLERSTRQVLAMLYDGLVAPLDLGPEKLWAHEAPDVGGRVPRLAFVPHGPLHQVPFHALFDGERYLIERFEVSYGPSATVYALCQRREQGVNRNGAMVFGVEDSTIPAALAEAHAVARHLPGAEVRTGEGATIEALRAGAPRSAILHLACHGIFRSDNPMFSALKLHDGWLAAVDVLGLDLPGSLVVLSACESGRSEVVGGDELLGLTRAFLGTGAGTLVVSLWLVQDETTASLMESWYGRMHDGVGRAAALRAAQLEVKKR